MSQTGRRKKSSPGFTRHLYGAGYTLIELILSVLIIAILAGISMPLFRKQFSDLELRNSCCTIAKLAGFAQQKAIGEGALYKINFDFEEGKYWLTSGEDLKEFKRLKTRYSRTYSVPREVEISGEKTSFIFYPSGASEKIDIILRGKNTAYTLQSKGYLGHVEIKKIGTE